MVVEPLVAVLAERCLNHFDQKLDLILPHLDNLRWQAVSEFDFASAIADTHFDLIAAECRTGTLAPDTAAEIAAEIGIPLHIEQVGLATVESEAVADRTECVVAIVLAALAVQADLAIAERRFGIEHFVVVPNSVVAPTGQNPVRERFADPATALEEPDTEWKVPDNFEAVHKVG